ncbi:DUF4328 domain-containing protein [Actinocorallia longicatena]|uniref:DUF4328 domain-containing protein n=1 Tax=Actinocorallia longicatena TaxID=111803 RepID=A0ABP6QL91_9ACTN
MAHGEIRAVAGHRNAGLAGFGVAGLGALGMVVAGLLAAGGAFGRDRAEDVLAVVTLAELGATVPCGIAFVAWMYRMRWNGETITRYAYRHGADHNLYGWYIPIANLWIPAEIVDDLWEASTPSEHSDTTLIWSWWVSFVLGNAALGVAFSLEPLLVAGAGLLRGVAALLGAVLVVKISALQQAAYAERMRTDPPRLRSYRRRRRLGGEI